MENIICSREAWGGKNHMISMVSVVIDKDPTKLTEAQKEIIRKHFNQMNEELDENMLQTHPDTIKRGNEERLAISNLFNSENVIIEIENKYYPPYKKAVPWYEVYTKKGRIIIGWRKRVIEIDYSGCPLEPKALDLFPDEDATKQGKTIHACDYEKAKEYVEKIINYEKIINSCFLFDQKTSLYGKSNNIQ